jgi:WD40 repeat protein/serine/threonine protein kinase
VLTLKLCARCGTKLRPHQAEGLCTRCLLESGLDAPQDRPAERFCDANPAENTGTDSTSSVPNKEAARSFGDYELLEEIARGGMGVVYRATQTSLGRIVALKMLLAGQFASKQLIQRFRGEVTAAALLQHPNIVAIHEVGIHDGQHYFSMDYVEGQNLSQIAGNRPLPPAKAARYVKLIAEAIHYAHQQGILHRDLKPSNVLIDSATDQPRITDFGLAKRLDGESSLTVTGQVLGSPNFMPPEQASNDRGKVGRHSDVYGLGAILYYLLAARAPFQAESLEGIVNQVLQTDPVPPRILNPSVPRDLETICLKSLRKEPWRRYQSASELVDELGRFLRHEPIEARPASPLEKAWRWCRRKPAIASLSAATALLLLAVAIGSPIALFRINQERERSEQNSYDSDIRLAQFAFDDGNLGLTLNRLRAHLRVPGKLDRRGFEWYYLWNLCKGEQSIILTNHTHAVSCVAFSMDGHRLATSAVGDPVYVWETASGNPVTTLPEQNVASLAFAAETRELGVGSQDQATVWNVETRTKVFEHKTALGKFQIAFSASEPSERLLILGTNSGIRRFGLDLGSVAVWDYVAHQLKKSLPANSGGYIAVSARGDQLVSGNSENKTKIWDLDTMQLIRAIDTGPVKAMALSPDGMTLVTSADNVAFWEMNTGRMIGWLTNYDEQVWSMAFSPNGQRLATGGVDQLVHVWDVQTRQHVQQLRGHESEVLALAFSPDGETLASGSKDTTVRLWNLNLDPKRLSTTISNANWRMIFSPDSRLIAAALEQGGVGVWDTETLQLRATFANAFDPVGFFPDSNTLIARGTNFFLGTFDVAANAIRQIVPGNPIAMGNSHTALSPDGKILALGLANGTLSFFGAQSGTLLQTETNAFSGNIFRMVFSRDGKLLAVAGREMEAGRPGAAKIWDTGTLRMVKCLVANADIVITVDFMPDGKTLATGGGDNAIRFWDTGTWREIGQPLVHKEPVNCLAISPDGKTVAAMSNYRGMKLWNPATGRELASLNESGIGYLVFSPNGQILAGHGRGIRLWRGPITDKNRF